MSWADVDLAGGDWPGMDDETTTERLGMENQHQKISGYRDLTQTEIDLMNEAKALEAQVLAFHSKVNAHLREQANETGLEVARQGDAQANRWLAIARTDIETGFMALVRSIAQPQPKG